MTAISAFLRKTPREALRQYFERFDNGRCLEVDWRAPESDLPACLMNAIGKMPPAQRDRVLHDAERVHALCDEAGQAALYSAVEDSSLLDGLENAYRRSLWMLLHAEDRFRRAEVVRLAATGRRGRMHAGSNTKHLNQMELARRWNLSHRTLERWRWTGEGPCFVKLGGRVVYRLEDVEAFEAEQIRQTTPGARRGLSSGEVA